METKAKSSSPVKSTDSDFSDISFEELLAQEKKDSFWLVTNLKPGFVSHVHKMLVDTKATLVYAGRETGDLNHAQAEKKLLWD